MPTNGTNLGTLGGASYDGGIPRWSGMSASPLKATSYGPSCSRSAGASGLEASSCFGPSVVHRIEPSISGGGTVAAFRTRRERSQSREREQQQRHRQDRLRHERFLLSARTYIDMRADVRTIMPFSEDAGTAAGCGDCAIGLTSTHTMLALVRTNCRSPFCKSRPRNRGPRPH